MDFRKICMSFCNLCKSLHSYLSIFALNKLIGIGRYEYGQQNQQAERIETHGSSGNKRCGRLSNVPSTVFARLKQREPEMSIASWAFRFAGSLPGVHTVLSGMTRMEHLQDNLRTYSPLKPLTEDDFAFLQEIAAQMMSFDTIPCNDCKYCMPCPYGLDIPAILLHYNKCLNEGNIPESAQDPDYRKARRAFLVGYDRSVPKLRQASRCIGCGQCSPHCPQRIDISGELHRIDAYVERLKQETGRNE